MAEGKRGWRQLERLSFDSRSLSRRAKKVEGATIRHARKFILHRLDNIREVRRHIIGWLVLMVLLIGLVAVQFMWFQRSYQTPAPAAGGTYAEATIGTIDTLNPLYATTASEVSASHLLFSSLYTYDKTGALSGDLATGMAITNNNTTYTIAMRPDAKWHDGTALTAKDVAYTISLIKDPATRSQLRINWQSVDVKAVDETHIQFTLPAAYAAFPQALTFAVLPVHVLRDVSSAAIRESTFSRSPVGSGPFRLSLLQTASDRHKIVQMTANDNYYRGQPLLDHFEIHAYNSADDVVRALKTGEVTAASDVPQDKVSSVSTANYDIVNQPISSTVYAIFNTAHPTMNDKLVREALRAGLSRAEVRIKTDPSAPASDYPILKNQLGKVSLPAVPGYDPGAAASYLDQAGWKLDGNVRKKDGQPLKVNVVTTKDSQYERTLDVMVVAWRKLGIQVDTTVYNTADPSVNFVRDTLQPRNFDVLLYELSIGGDPDVYAYWHSSQTAQRGTSGYNFANYSNGVSDDALSSARLTLDTQLRDLKYTAFINQWVSDVPAIGLYQPTSHYVHTKHVISVDSTTRFITPYSRYSGVLYWSVRQAEVYRTP